MHICVFTRMPMCVYIHLYIYIHIGYTYIYVCLNIFVRICMHTHNLVSLFFLSSQAQYELSQALTTLGLTRCIYNTNRNEYTPLRSFPSSDSLWYRRFVIMLTRSCFPSFSQAQYELSHALTTPTTHYEEARVHTHTHTYIYVYIYIYIYIYMCVCVCVYMYVYIYKSRIVCPFSSQA